MFVNLAELGEKLNNEHSIAFTRKIDFDTAENGPSRVWC